jgi:hypothetical protein
MRTLSISRLGLFMTAGAFAFVAAVVFGIL